MPGCTPVLATLASTAWLGRLPQFLSAELPGSGILGGFGYSVTFLTFKAPGWPAQGPGEMPSALLSTWAPT